MIKKAVIPAAGLGTRLLPATKEQPKEMLPVFCKENGNVVLKPFLQVLFERLHKAGFREFCIIAGKSKRAIEDHFTPDKEFVNLLESKKKNDTAGLLKEFYQMIENSNIFWVNQAEPKGFGDAVYCAKNFVNSDYFLVNAGDDIIVSNKDPIKRLCSIHEKFKPDISLMVQRVEDPRRFGVIVGEEKEDGLYDVSSIIEKPKDPPSNLAVIGVYIFSPKIFTALENVKPDQSGEKQLTDAIQYLITKGAKVLAVELAKDEKRVDIGTVETYRETLNSMIL
ncbi:MAG TPA: UTP--glucose-1-phosphate uridylyltransferase [archaeon]|nr:UTP--glucose-1-phosphate uridylyltransferase [archaeon]